MGAAMAVVGLYQAYQQYQAGQYAKAVGNMQADAYARSAADAAQRGRNEEARVREAYGRLEADQRVAGASSGVDIQSGTPLDLIVATAGMGELDALTARNNAAREAWGLQIESLTAKTKGKSAARSATGQAMGTLLTTGIAAYDRRQQTGSWWE